ncbi:anthranilate 1,2-dioxygenase regulatory protein AndR [Burkholderia sp. 22313]|uniref:anthranilate 1,2-dioxygenase regulatory protein AndR n=1 Tax=Burkholderia sp. 22313 TaxID=3453908 RepID=UPI003F87D8AB
MLPQPFNPSALRAYRLFESQDLDETREQISRVMQSHTLSPSDRERSRSSRMNFVALNSVGIGTIRFGNAMRVLVDAIDGYHLLMFCLAGSARVRTMGRDLFIDTQTAVLCPSGECFDAQLSSDCEQFVLRIDTSMLEPWEGGDGMGLGPSLNLGHAALRSWMQQLALVSSSHEMLAQASANPRVADRLAHLLIDLLDDAHAASPRAAAQRDLAASGARRAQAYMEAHFDQPLQIADIARAAETSERTLRTLFLQLHGTSPMRYLRDLRLDRARERLKSAKSRFSVAEIALDCGFTHLGRFAIAYREKFGERPSDTGRP